MGRVNEGNGCGGRFEKQQRDERWYAGVGPELRVDSGEGVRVRPYRLGGCMSWPRG